MFRAFVHTLHRILAAMIRSSNLRLLPVLALGATFAPSLRAQLDHGFHPGGFAVSRVGDGSATLDGSAHPRFLDVYTDLGVYDDTIALPTTVVGANRRLTDSGTATSQGFLSQSADARYVLVSGYDAAVGTASVATTTAAAVNRVIGRIDLDGNVDTSTALTDAYSGSNFRSVASLDGTSFWTGGNPGARYVVSLGATTSTQLATNLTNLRVVNIFAGQLYCSSASGAFQGLSTVGAGLPTTSGQTITLLPGFPAAAGPQPYDFFFADANTVYVADDRTSGVGGIQKWVFAAGTWTLAYTLAPSATTGCRGISGSVDNGVATLLATTTTNLVVKVTDTGAASPFTTLVTGAANTALRDVLFIRRPPSLTWSGTACPNTNGTPTVGTAGGDPVTGNLGFQITASNVGAGSFTLILLLGNYVFTFGVPIPGAPPCALTYMLPDVLLGGFASPTGTLSTPVGIPANSSLGGAALGAQVAAFDLSLVGYPLPIGTSDALQVIIGN